MMSELLTRRPPKEENESVEGYLFRLSLINFTPLNYTDFKLIKANSAEKEIAEYFDLILKNTGHKYNKEQLIHDWYFDYLTLPNWQKLNNTRFCPRCLVDSVYHRFFWSISLYTYCYRHNCYLNEICDVCSKKTGIEDIVRGVCKKCNSILSESKIYSSDFQNKTLIDGSYISPYYLPFLSSRATPYCSDSY